jgi:serine/threonine protein kinase
MTDRWHAAKAIFQAALERDPGERAAFLDAACAGDEALRAAVDDLLAADATAGDFLQTPVWRAEALAPAEDDRGLDGQLVGPYRIIRRIGEGGMGAVHLASRADDVYQKRVALKIVKPGMDTEAVVARFRNERETLAGLDHPNIARLLDGGTTGDGRPYFVMDYVEGEPLDLYCDHHGLSIAERVTLFRQVCAAVHYAHQNLVVHRDLKPDNILVTSDGVPKLVDFGIAKVLSHGAAFQTLDMAGAHRLLTYEYASPEQVRGGPVTTASDVYSLGVVVYELLSGRRPYELSGKSLSEIERIVCEEDPPRPSTALGTAGRSRGGDSGAGAAAAVSRTRQDHPAALRRRLAGDLDMIVLKALRKEPQRRYGSVEQLSADLQRHLDGLPVSARPDTVRYRTAKFVRRHKAGVAAAAAIVFLLAAGVVATAWQARVAGAQRERAERRFNEVRQLANSYLFELHDPIAKLAGSTPVRQLLVTRALEYLSSLAQEASDDPELQLELAAAYRKIGDVQGNPYEANLGDPAGAMASYERSLSILEAVAEGASGRADVERGLAATHERLGDIRAVTGDTTGALESQRAGLSIRQALAAGASVPAGDRGSLAASYSKVAASLAWTGDNAGALSHYREALRIRQALSSSQAGSVEAQTALAATLSYVADMLMGAGDLAGALEHLRQAVAIGEAWSVKEPTDVRNRRTLAISYTKQGEALAARGDGAAAAASHLKALAIRQGVVDADPANAQARRDLAISHSMVAEILQGDGQRSRALEHVKRSVGEFEDLAARAGMSTQSQADLAVAYATAGRILLAAGQSAGGIRRYEQAVGAAEAVAASDPGDYHTRRQLVRAYVRLADAHAAEAEKRGESPRGETGPWAQARAQYRKAHDLLQAMRTARGLETEDASLVETVEQGLERSGAPAVRAAGPPRD